jgi:uncharacterized protein
MIPSPRAAHHISIGLAVFVFLLGTNILGPIVAGIFLGVGLPEWAPIISVVIGWMPIIWLMFFKWKLQQANFRDMLPLKYTAKYFGICLIAFPLVLCSVTFSCIEIRALLPSFPNLALALFSTSLLVPMGETLPQTIARVALVILVIPICEELYFRVFLLAACRTRWGITRALLFTSVLFGVLHGDWLGHTLYGLIWGGIALYTGRIFWAILSHMLVNASAVIGSVILANRSFFHDLSLFASSCGQLDTIGQACIAVSLASAIYLVWHARKNENSLPQ